MELRLELLVEQYPHSRKASVDISRDDESLAQPCLADRLARNSRRILALCHWCLFDSRISWFYRGYQAGPEKEGQAKTNGLTKIADACVGPLPAALTLSSSNAEPSYDDL